MGTDGYRRQAGRRNGGVTALALASVDSVSSVTWDRATGHATDIEMTGGGSFALYHFREGSARFTEDCTTVGGHLKVEREISFALERLDANQRSSIGGLLAASAGLVALVYNDSGSVHLAGINRRSGKAFPLKVRQCQTQTGQSPLDLSGDVITLYGGDTARASLFTGTVEFKDQTP